MKRKLVAEEKLLVTLGYPSLLLFFGILLFHAQWLTRWWRPEAPSNALLVTFCIVTLFFGFALAGVCFYAFTQRTWRELKHAGWSRPLRLAAFAALYALLAAGAFSALKPAHTVQEGDFLRYHVLLPKLHWISGNWKPIEWNELEFATISVQDGLSFLWVGLPLLNKLPQFMLLCFLLLKVWYSFTLFGGIKRPYLTGFIAVLGLCAFRGIATQVGSSMMDLPNLYYLFSLAFSVAYLRKDGRAGARLPWILSLIIGIDCAAYLGFKSFAFILLGVMAVAAEVLARVLWRESLLKLTRRVHWSMVALPVALLWLPEVIRSFYYTGDPFWPVFPKLTDLFCDQSRLTIRACADNSGIARILQRMAFSDFGFGHNPVAYLKTIALAGVHWPFERHGFFFGRNVFDYPLGLFWYLGFGLLAYFAAVKGPRRRPALFALGLAGAFYTIWFSGCQQSRWLYPVLAVFALFWGYVLGADAARRRHLATGALLLTIGLVTFNAAKVLLVQRESLDCWGVECLKYKQPAYDDYVMKCPPTPVVVEDFGWRGYLHCETTGRSPIKDYRGASGELLQ